MTGIRGRRGKQLLDKFRKNKDVLNCDSKHYISICGEKVKVKVTLVQALRLCTGRTAHRGSRGIALPFHDHGTRRGGGQRHTPAVLYPRERPGTHCTGGWVGPGPVWTAAENLAHTGIRSLDRPARSQSLYRLSYSAQSFCRKSLK